MDRICRIAQELPVTTQPLPLQCPIDDVIGVGRGIPAQKWLFLQTAAQWQEAGLGRGDFRRGELPCFLQRHAQTGFARFAKIGLLRIRHQKKYIVGQGVENLGLQ